MSCDTDWSVDVEQGVTYRLTIQEGTEANQGDSGAILGDDGSSYIVPTDWTGCSASWKFYSREDTTPDLTLTNSDGSVTFGSSGHISLLISLTNGRKLPICESSGDPDFGPHSKLIVTFPSTETEKVFDVCLNVEGEDQ